MFKILLIILGIILFLGVLRLLFTKKQHDGILDVICDLTLLSLFFDNDNDSMSGGMSGGGGSGGSFDIDLDFD